MRVVTILNVLATMALAAPLEKSAAAKSDGLAMPNLPIITSNQLIRRGGSLSRGKNPVSDREQELLPVVSEEEADADLAVAHKKLNDAIKSIRSVVHGIQTQEDNIKADFRNHLTANQDHLTAFFTEWKKNVTATTQRRFETIKKHLAQLRRLEDEYAMHVKLHGFSNKALFTFTSKHTEVRLINSRLIDLDYSTSHSDDFIEAVYKAVFNGFSKMTPNLEASGMERTKEVALDHHEELQAMTAQYEEARRTYTIKQKLQLAKIWNMEFERTQWMQDAKNEQMNGLAVMFQGRNDDGLMDAITDYVQRVESHFGQALAAEADIRAAAMKQFHADFDEYTLIAADYSAKPTELQHKNYIKHQLEWNKRLPETTKMIHEMHKLDKGVVREVMKDFGYTLKDDMKAWYANIAQHRKDYATILEEIQVEKKKLDKMLKA